LEIWILVSVIIWSSFDLRRGFPAARGSLGSED
jgi:hypothetical protein